MEMRRFEDRQERWDEKFRIFVEETERREKRCDGRGRGRDAGARGTP